MRGSLLSWLRNSSESSFGHLANDNQTGQVLLQPSLCLIRPFAGHHFIAQQLQPKGGDIAQDRLFFDEQDDARAGSHGGVSTEFLRWLYAHCNAQP